MLRFLVNRILLALPTVLIVSIAVFALIRFIPGDPASLMLGDMAEPQQIEAMRTELGLDRPLPVQFMVWAERAMSGDLGKSIATGEAVGDLVVSKFFVSAQIVVLAVLLASLIAVPAGVIAAWKQNSFADLALVGTATVLLSIPTFWLGLLLLLFFGLKLGWLPVLGYVSIADKPGESPRILRRLKSLRGLSHEEVKQVFTRSSRARSADGAGAPRGVPVAVGSH
jgi:peptide/nickel transport system permease protein